MEADPRGGRPAADSRTVAPAGSVAEIHAFLASFAAVREPIAGDVPADLVRHGVRTADLLAAEHPGDLELQVAGLLHDIGLLLVPGDELGHPRHGARYVRGLFGDRCAELIDRHVDAQRYLEATVPGYTVAPPPTAAFAEQATAMTAAEAAAFEAHPMFAAITALRSADDRADGAAGTKLLRGVWGVVPPQGTGLFRGVWGVAPTGAFDRATQAGLRHWAGRMDRLAERAADRPGGAP